jgi:hypothetical protein
MTPAQLARLECLDSAEFLTPFEDEEHRHLLRLQSEMMQAFNVLEREGFRPTWIAGEHIIANVPGFRSLPGGRTVRFTEPEIVHSLPAALRLIHSCS